mgnify:CR=1 FL=1
MNIYKNTDKDIHLRMYRFVIGCFRDVVRKIPKRTENLPIISQLSSSLTSMGANDREADAAGSQRDFVAKYMIVRKESNETVYWLSVVNDLHFVESSVVSPYIKECKEILSIISSIIKSAKRIE